MAQSAAVYPNNSAPQTNEELVASANNRLKQPYGSVRNVKFANNDPIYNQPTHEQFNASYAKRGINVPKNEKSSDNSIRNVSVTSQQIKSPTRSNNYQTKNKFDSKSSTIEKYSLLSHNLKAAKSRVKKVNIFIRSFGFYTWLFPQIILALLNLTALSIAFAIETAAEANKVKAGDAVLNKIFKTVGNAVIDVGKIVTDTALSVAGINLSSLDPINIYFITTIILFVFGLSTLLGMYFVYKINNLSPLGGSGGGSKMGTFIIALVGYTIPILNLFPWFYLWTIAVQRHPK